MPLREDEIWQVESLIDAALKKTKTGVEDLSSYQREVEKWRDEVSKYQKSFIAWITQFEKDKALSERLERILPELEKLVGASPKTKKSGGKKK